MIGASGYIAPKHFEAIKKTKNNLVAAYDVSQTAGKIDSFFKDCKFFFNFKEFQKFINIFKKTKKIHFLVICAPNYLHYKYINFGLKNKFEVICEKPLVLKSNHLHNIIKLEKKYKKKVNCIMQLRLNKKLIKYKKIIEKKIKKNPTKTFTGHINYFTFRGDWFLKSWKGSKKKSGGLTTNIGIHLFDLLYWYFGEYEKFKIYFSSPLENRGVLYFKNVKISWLISISSRHLKKGLTAKREFIFDKDKIQLSDNFNDLHTKSYDAILKKRGFGTMDVFSSIKLTERLRD